MALISAWRQFVRSHLYEAKGGVNEEIRVAWDCDIDWICHALRFGYGGGTMDKPRKLAF